MVDAGDVSVLAGRGRARLPVRRAAGPVVSGPVCLAERGVHRHADPYQPAHQRAGGAVAVRPSRAHARNGQRPHVVAERGGEERLGPSNLLTGRGTPATVSAWQQVFKDAKTRCARHAVRIRCHPHALRHSFERRLGLPHATFYRNFADLIQQFQQQTSARRLNRKLTVPVRRRGETPGVEAQCRRPFEGEARSGTIATELLAERRLTPPDLPGVPPKSTSRHAHRRSVQERLLVEPF